MERLPAADRYWNALWKPVTPFLRLKGAQPQQPRRHLYGAKIPLLYLIYYTDPIAAVQQGRRQRAIPMKAITTTTMDISEEAELGKTQ